MDAPSDTVYQPAHERKASASTIVSQKSILWSPRGEHQEVSSPATLYTAITPLDHLHAKDVAEAVVLTAPPGIITANKSPYPFGITSKLPVFVVRLAFPTPTFIIDWAVYDNPSPYDVTFLCLGSDAAHRGGVLGIKDITVPMGFENLPEVTIDENGERCQLLFKVMSGGGKVRCLGTGRINCNGLRE